MRLSNKMDLLVRLDINLFSLVISALIFFDMYNRNEKQFLQYRLFIALLLSNMVLLVLDSLSWVLDGHSGPAILLALISVNILYYIMNPLPPFLWSLYAHYQVFHDGRRTRKLFLPLLIPVIIFALISITNPLTDWLFFFDGNNVYHRGNNFYLVVIICYTYLICTFVFIFMNKRSIEKRHFIPLLLFPVPPFICGILQAVSYGLVLVWSSITLSILIVYHSIQNHRLSTDFLTNIYNRNELEQYLNMKIRNSANKNLFSGIFIDIDNFKQINDSYGHKIGDNMLIDTAELIRKSLRKDDFLARYGGDEFVVILDIHDVSVLEQTVLRINSNVMNYNSNSEYPFKLSISMGYGIYDPESGMDKEMFIKHIDDHMYEKKK
ncbi:MAG: diguanylate cyclase [Eubacteriales bacterium]